MSFHLTLTGNTKATHRLYSKKIELKIGVSGHIVVEPMGNEHCERPAFRVRPLPTGMRYQASAYCVIVNTLEDTSTYRPADGEIYIAIHLRLAGVLQGDHKGQKSLHSFAAQGIM